MQNFPRHIILLALADGALHGYQIQELIMGLSGGNVYLPLTSLYRDLKFLDNEGYIERVAAKPAMSKRRPYALTRKGQNELHRAAIVYGEFAEQARSKLT